MRISMSPCCKQAQPAPLVNFPGGLSMEPFLPWRRKPEKVVVVMGATGTGKSRLSLDLAARFPAEIINSDKMQVYKGLDIVTNKVTEEECHGIPHHLLGTVDDPDEDFTANDFLHHASIAIESITRRGRLPIIAGGSNSLIRALVLNGLQFHPRYEFCFLWVDVAMPVLHSFVSDRVDRMVEAGLIDEVREFFDPRGDYTVGIRRAIGVPEMDEFFRNEFIVDDETKAKILVEAIDKIKANTCKLACRQRQKILSLQGLIGWNMHHFDATEIFLRRGADADEAWERLVARTSTKIVKGFLSEDNNLVSAIATPPPPPSPAIIATAAVAAATPLKLPKSKTPQFISRW